MKVHPKITVVEWSESQPPITSHHRAQQRLVPPVVIGVIGTLLLHTLVVPSALSGYRAPKAHSPDLQSLGSTLDKTDITPADNLVLIDLSSGSINKGSGDLPMFALSKIKLPPILAARPDPPPPLDLGTLTSNDEQESTAPQDNGDGNERARLVGIYSRQMTARVERIWRRPRKPVNDGMDPSKVGNAVEYFQCQVQIVQDAHGNVQEILLPNCNGTVTWQRSLVMAIQQASPLPAPPSRTVFSRTVTLDFVGYPYHDGESADNYELVAEKTAETAGASPR